MSVHRRSRPAFYFVIAICMILIGSKFVEPLLAYAIRSTPNLEVVSSRSFSNPLATWPIISGPYNQFRPGVAYNPVRNEFLLAWTHDTRGLSDPDEPQGNPYGTICAQRLSPSGSPLGGSVQLSQTDAAYHAKVVYNPVANEYLVVWWELAGGSGPADIYGQRLSSTGAKLGSVIPICTAGRQQRNPAVACNTTDGSYFVAWGDERNTQNREGDIYGQLLNANGSLVGGNVVLCADPRTQEMPSVGYNPRTNSYLVSWASFPETDIGDIYARYVSAQGIPVGDKMSICTAKLFQWKPVVATLGLDETFLVCWQDNRESQGSDIFDLRVGPTGPVANEMIVERAVSDQLKPAVAPDGVSRYLVVWEDRRNTYDRPNIHDVYGRCVDRDGQALDQAFAICRDTGDQGRPAVAFNSLTGAYLVVWQDNRSGNYDIYGTQVSACAEPMPTATWAPATFTPTRTRTYTPIATPMRGKVSLPLVLRQLPPWCDPYEPNNDRQVNPWGPLVLGQSYQAKICRGDLEDNYYFEVATATSIRVRLQLPASLVAHMGVWVYAAHDLSCPLPACGGGPIMETDYCCTCALPRAGRYVVRLYSENPDVYYDNLNPYTLQVTYQ